MTKSIPRQGLETKNLTKDLGSLNARVTSREDFIHILTMTIIKSDRTVYLEHSNDKQADKRAINLILVFLSKSINLKNSKLL